MMAQSYPNGDDYGGTFVQSMIEYRFVEMQIA